MLIEVMDVVLGDRPEGCRAHLDHPRVGELMESAREMLVVGWALGPDGPAELVEIRIAGQVVSRVKPGVERPDLAEAFPYVRDAGRGGFRTEVGLGATPSWELEAWAELRDGTRFPIAELRLRRRWREDELFPHAALVSVVIPCHDQAPFLAEAIESVLGQSYPHLEVIVVDDGSTDNTEAVAQSYPATQYVRHSQMGLSAARNTGLRLASGSYVVFLDADDRLMPNALELGLRHLAEHPEAAFVSGRCRLVAFDGVPLTGVLPQQVVTADHHCALLSRNYIWSHATVMYRRAVFEQVGTFSTALEACEDYEMYLRISREFPVFCHGETIADYRQHGRNMSRDPARMLRAALAVLEAHKPPRSARRAHRTAHRRGIVYWKRLYGRRTAREARSAFGTRGERRRALHDVRVLARSYPTGLLRVVFGGRAESPEASQAEQAEQPQLA